jgi:general stress protein YciG
MAMGLNAGLALELLEFDFQSRLLYWKFMSKRGFAAMDPDLQRQIASRGGKSAHAQGKAHEFTPDEAQAAGKLGGKKVSEDVDHMRELGRKGGLARRKKLAEKAQSVESGSDGSSGS